MKINYTDADGTVKVWEVDDEKWNDYEIYLDDEAKTERKETRRHTLLSAFTYEDSRFFDSGIDISGDAALADAVNRALDTLSERQRYLLTKVYIEGWRYTELAKAEKRDESTIRKATEKAKEKFIKNILPDYPI